MITWIPRGAQYRTTSTCPLVGVKAHTMSDLVSSIIFFQSEKISD